MPHTSFLRNHGKTSRTPRRPFEKERLDNEMKLIGEFGLKNKREVWRTQLTLARIRKAARVLLTLEEKDPRRMFEGEALLRCLPPTPPWDRMCRASITRLVAAGPTGSFTFCVNARGSRPPRVLTRVEVTLGKGGGEAERSQQAAVGRRPLVRLMCHHPRAPLPSGGCCASACLMRPSGSWITCLRSSPRCAALPH